MNKYDTLPLLISDKEAFTEASKEELRVLLALIECGGVYESEDSLAKMAKTSRARCSSAIVFWEAEGVIRKSDREPTITEEFEERLRAGEIAEESALSVAKSIRKNDLADMINECAALMNKQSFNTDEVKKLTALHDQYGFSPEYIVTLSAYLSGSSTKLTVTTLVNKATKLHEMEIYDLSSLEDYISEKESECQAEREFRKIFGIYNRSLSKSEKEKFTRWSKNYGYYNEIVTEAYDIATNNASQGFLNYADKLLTRWAQTGCRTVDECRMRYEADEAERKAEKEEQAKRRKAEKAAAEKPRYGDFDPNAALMRALERSYGSQDSEKTQKDLQ